MHWQPHHVRVIAFDALVTFVTLGHVISKPVLLALGGLLVTAALMARGAKSAIIVGIFAVTLGALALGIAQPPAAIVQKPDWHSTFLQLDIRGAWQQGLFEIVFVFLFVDMFDTIGSLMGLGQQAGFLDADGKMPRVNRALLADAIATIAGALFGASTW